MMKLLLLLAVVAVALFMFKSRQRRKGQAPRGTAQPQPRPSAAAEPATMVACAHCGVHLPKDDVLAGVDGRPYCTEAHRLAGPR